MYPERLPVWIIASVYKEVTDYIVANTTGWSWFIEGMPRLKGTKTIELRHDGPNTIHHSKNHYDLVTEFNILLSHSPDAADDTESIYEMTLMADIIRLAFPETLRVKKYGPDAVLDDGSFVACARQIVTSNRGSVEVSSFGEVDVGSGLHQTAVESHYLLTYNGA